MIIAVIFINIGLLLKNIGIGSLGTFGYSHTFIRTFDCGFFGNYRNYRNCDLVNDYGGLICKIIKLWCFEYFECAADETIRQEYLLYLSHLRLIGGFKLDVVVRVARRQNSHWACLYFTWNCLLGNFDRLVPFDGWNFIFNPIFELLDKLDLWGTNITRRNKTVSLLYLAITWHDILIIWELRNCGFESEPEI